MRTKQKSEQTFNRQVVAKVSDEMLAAAKALRGSISMSEWIREAMAEKIARTPPLKPLVKVTGNMVYGAMDVCRKCGGKLTPYQPNPSTPMVVGWRCEVCV